MFCISIDWKGDDDSKTKDPDSRIASLKKWAETYAEKYTVVAVLLNILIFVFMPSVELFKVRQSKLCVLYLLDYPFNGRAISVVIVGI